MKITNPFFWLITGAFTAFTVQAFFIHPLMGNWAGIVTFTLFLALGGLDWLISVMIRMNDENYR